MKIRNLLVAAATFASLGGTVGLANAPQATSAALPAFHKIEQGVDRYQLIDDEIAREPRATKNAQRMTALQRQSYRKNFGIHFVRRNAATTQ